MTGASMLHLLLLAGPVISLTPANRKLVETWAPAVWLHSQDPFYPSSIDFHLENVQMRSEDEHVVQEFPRPDNIFTGPVTENFHLNTLSEIDCVNCFQPFFYGQPLQYSPVYTFVTEHNDSCNTVDVTYAVFFPFNYGKDVCVGLDQFGVCLGEVKTFGNHVGDWEHVSLRLQGGEPSQIYVGVHSFGAWYTWDRANQWFFFDHGEPLHRNKKGRGRVLEMRIDVDYPDFLYLEEGRPSVFCANGSHGMWAMEGKHTYLQILTVHLDDYTDKGTLWKTWENLKIYETRDLDSFTGPDSWINFRGSWGNIKKMGCELEPIFGQCGMTGGPSGPFKYFQHDFPQPPFCSG